MNYLISRFERVLRDVEKRGEVPPNKKSNRRQGTREGGLTDSLKERKGKGKSEKKPNIPRLGKKDIRRKTKREEINVAKDTLKKDK